MKKRVTIYVEAETWIDIRHVALLRGTSASQYLVNLHRDFRGGNAEEAPPEEKSITMKGGSKISFTGKGEKHEGHPDAPDPFFNPQPKKGKK